ncbi:type I polyketide synthase [Pseudorhizobium pelagicum]|uniref:type I polyketide synthase n=2 Tax=Pseudorhizobium pelagicum TaxID=1509405 RepID=UPI0009DE2F61|nr:type I polyketide synthase [Pseudorhizobium pelagicum]
MLDGRHQVAANDIAIVGMAVRVPGAADLEQFWSNLRHGVESIRDLSQEELLAAGEDPGRLSQPNYVARAADLAGMEMFDAEFFGLSPKEAAIMDPQHRQFLECAWEALENAGRIPTGKPEPVGVFAGCGMGSYFYFNICSNRQLVDQVGLFLLRHTGNDKDFLATRASFLFDLRGPSINIQTACSTSLVAVHTAAQSLLSGECDWALAGGSTIEFPHRRGYLYQAGEILSPDGRCRPFDHRAAGTVFGSGTGVVVLRRLADALSDGNIIHAVIKSTAINNDGSSKAGYLAPSVSGQAEAIVEAQSVGDIAADTIQYVECHGTGTPLGDPIEIEALTQAFRKTTARTGFCYVGSAKSNIGHLDTAAGVVGLIKATLAVKHGEIPPTLGFERPNPSIDFDKTPFKVCARLTPWPKTPGPRRAAVNSLGVGGTNAHVILEEAPVPYVADALQKEQAGAHGDPLLLLLSARSRAALDAGATRLKDWLERHDDLALQDVAKTLFDGRGRFEQSLVLTVRHRQEALEALAKPQEHGAVQTQIAPAPGAVFMFPGGGVQYPGMAATLFDEDAGFRHCVEEGLSALEPQLADEIRSIWFSPKTPQAQACFLRPAIQLPAILIVEVALARLWQRLGVEPVALIGHSMGEYAAACLAGVMEFRDAVRLVRLRGELFETVEPSGMLSVPLDEQAVKAILPPTLDLACVNAPGLCVVSGHDAALDTFRQMLNDRDVDARPVAIRIAAHSRLLDKLLHRFEAFVATIALRAPAIPIISNLTGVTLTDDEATDPGYWGRHLRHTVRFADGLTTLSQDRARVYIEVGPGRVLSSLAKVHGALGPHQIINSLPHGEDNGDDHCHLVTALGRAYCAGLPVNLRQWVARTGARMVTLPSYAFQHKRYFIEASRNASGSGQARLISKEADIARWGYRPGFQRSVVGYALGAEAAARTWLFFLDDEGLGQTLVERLRTHGHRVVTVTRGDSFVRRDAQTYLLCPEMGAAGYQALVADLQNNGLLPSRLVHLWLADRRPRLREGSSSVHQFQEWGFESLALLGQSWAELAPDEELAATVVSRGILQVDESDPVCPDKALVLGPVRVLPKEQPRLSVRLVDVDPAGAADVAAPRRWRARGGTSQAQRQEQHALANDLWEELLAPPACEIVALRQGRRWLQASLPHLLPPVVDPAKGFRRHGVYLFAGGFSEVGLALAGELAAKYAARLVLVSRLTLPPAEVWQRLGQGWGEAAVRRAIAAIDRLEEAGAEVLHIRADVTDFEQMSAAVTAASQRFGGLDGVFHCAGALEDGLLTTKTLEGMQRVLAPKVSGARVLGAVLATVPLDFLVLFSSTSTDVPRAGQVDYAAANAYLNAYACSAATGERRVIAVHWGVWNEVGLAARAIGRGRTVELPSRPAHGPLLTRWMDDGGLPFLEATIATNTHWVLDEHRISSGAAVFPGTGYVEMLVQAAVECGLGPQVHLRELAFIRPMALEDGQPRVVRLRLEQQGAGVQVSVTSKHPEDRDGHEIVHAHAFLEALQPRRRSALDLDLIRSRCHRRRTASDGAGLASVQARHLRFGRRWDVLRAVAFGSDEAVADLVLADEFLEDLGQYRIHPALFDIATGFALELSAHYDESRTLWVPVGYGELDLHAPLPAKVVSWVRLSALQDLEEGFSSFDITIADPQGNVLAEVSRLTMCRTRDAVQQMDETRHAATAAAAHRSPAMLKLETQVKNGISASEGLQALERVLSLPHREMIVSSIDLQALSQFVDEPPAGAVSEAGASFERPDLASAYVAPRSPVEETLASFWQSLLGVERVGIDDNFFDLGGHSLIAVRLFRMIKSQWGVDLPMSVLFEAPTVAACAERIGVTAVAPAKPTAQEVGSEFTAAPPAAQPIHLVAMSPGPSSPAQPLFICAGMFGNVLNLRHLAMAIGKDRPVVGLQARGLFGDHEPHRRFEDMALACIEEMRGIQPKGPYLLAGYSGGGITAMEIAQQLVAAGETVAHLALIDTPLPRQPRLSLADKLAMKSQDLGRHRAGYLRKWHRDRHNSRQERHRKQIATATGEASEGFNNVRIELAFRAAAQAYVVKPYHGAVTLFRPRPAVFYRLSKGRCLAENRHILLHDNGWGSHVADLTVVEIPGDHDSMVLDPFVRVLAERLRPKLRIDAHEHAGDASPLPNTTPPEQRSERALEAFA